MDDRHPCVELALEPLSESATEEYLQARFGGRALPAGFARAVHRRTCGNPLFIDHLATRAAADGERLVLVGVEPTRPDPAYGYLRLGRVTRSVEAHRVVHFVEKPTRARARRFVSGGGYLWNSGMLLARPSLILAETRALAPEIWRALGPTLSQIAEGRTVSRAAFARAWARARARSFDYAVLERSRRVSALRGRFAWSDLGSWDALGERLMLLDGNRVHCMPRPLLLEAKRNVVWSSADRQVVLLGVRDLLVIQTTDALLVCANDRAQDVRKVVDEFTRQHREELV